MTTKATPAPSGCRHCGVEAREHLQRWTAAARWHSWVEPTQEQRKARMLARREVAQVDGSGEAS